MADLSFASYRQGPLGEAIQANDNMGALPPPTFSPAITLTRPDGGPETIGGPAMRLLAPGDIAKLLDGTAIRTDPPAGAVDVEPNYMALAEVVPAELPWLLTPAKAAGGRLRPWFVLAVLEAAKAPFTQATPLPTIEAEIAELPDLRDSWGWAHVQHATGAGPLPGGGQAAAAQVGRLLCPRRLSPGVTYRACLVPAFQSGIAAGLGDPHASQAPHDLAWKVEEAGSVRLPVFHQWTFTTGPSGDFEKLVSRLEPADPEALRVSSVRPVDARSPWPGDKPLAEGEQLVGVQGALVPFEAPPTPEPAASAETLAAFDQRIRAQLDEPAERLREAPSKGVTGSLAPPLYGGRHVSQDLVSGEPAWLAGLNTSIANRIAAGLGTNYVRANQEDLMAKAWQQVGAIREANRLRAMVELTTEVSSRVHERHIASLQPGELIALAAPASVRTKTSDLTTLAMETRMSRMVDGAASSAFARRVRPAGKLARRTGASVRTLIPKALAGEVTVPAGAPVIPDTPAVLAAGLTDVSSEAAASQLIVMAAMARVATLNNAAVGGKALVGKIQGLLGDDLSASIEIGTFKAVATAIVQRVEPVSELTSSVLTEMSVDQAFGPVSAFGVPIVDSELAERVTSALHPGDMHHERLASQTQIPEHLAPADPSGPVMACPQFPVPAALALLESDPEWFMPGLGALPANRVALLRQNGAFIESYLVGINHEMMRELLWREYPTDRRGTAFARFWPRPDGHPDIAPIDTWTDPAALGTRLAQADGLSVLLVRGDVVRRYPGMVVTAVHSGLPDDAGHHRPDPNGPSKSPIFTIEVDEATMAYGFEISNAELVAPASAAKPGWFFVFAEHGFRIRFGFDEPPDAGERIDLSSWDQASWPASDGGPQPSFVPLARGHASAGAGFGPAGNAGPDGPRWNRDAADIARIALQRPFRVAVQAEVLLRPAGGR